MTKREQKAFVRSLLAKATKGILAALDASPFTTETWDGHELRLLCTDHVAWIALGNVAEVRYKRRLIPASRRLAVQLFRMRHRL